ncbi:MAG: YceI family protein, partial [Acidobacteriota bacterium]
MIRAANWMFSVALLATLPGLAQVSDWQIDSAHTAAQFSVRHMMVSNVRGQFGKTTGSARFDPKDPTKATLEVSVDVASIDTREPKRDAHLKGADFFDAEKFPVITFRSKRVEAAGAGRLKVVGDLT